MSAVTVAAIHGHCIGGGVVLAAACDLRVAADDTYFSIPEVDLGIPLTWGGIPRLVREIGPALTRELVLTCRPFTAAEAQAFGFLNRVVPAEQVRATAEELADGLSSKSRLTLTATKRHVNAVLDTMSGATGSWSDADGLVTALHDPESAGRRAPSTSRRCPPGLRVPVRGIPDPLRSSSGRLGRSDPPQEVVTMAWITGSEGDSVHTGSSAGDRSFRLLPCGRPRRRGHGVRDDHPEPAGLGSGALDPGPHGRGRALPRSAWPSPRTHARRRLTPGLAPALSAGPAPGGTRSAAPCSRSSGPDHGDRPAGLTRCRPPAGPGHPAAHPRRRRPRAR